MGGAPVPLSQFVLKVHSRCDLACDHCYVYEAADQSWRRRPIVISDEVTVRAAARIAEHARAHSLSIVQVVLHGGEPLLAGRDRLERIITALRGAAEGTCRLDLRIHTNGVRLSEAFCEIFLRHRVKVGISLDGDRAANDRHRRYSDGRSSYDKVVAAVGLLRQPRFRHLYAGLLCTIDTANDPLTVYDSLAELGPPRIDFLLPHATWDDPPARSAPGGTAYADWLNTIYDRWAAQGRPMRIRTFDSVLSTLAGGPSFTEALGLEPVTLAVIETDGSYEQVDSLKAAFDGAPDTGTNVFDDDLDTVAQHPGIQARQRGIAGLSETCQRCPVVTSCGGGLYTHRYRTGNGFDNPSVYCADLLKLITHIGSNRGAATAPPRIPVHALAATDLAALAAGAGGAAVVTQLADAQQSLLRAMLGSVYRAADLAGMITADLSAAWSLLTKLDRAAPQALGAVLRHPYVRVWATRCLRQLRASVAGPDEDAAPGGLTAGLGHLGAIATAAAVRARADATLTVPIIDTAVYLPTLGRLDLGAAGGGQPATSEHPAAFAEVSGGTVTIRAAQMSWTLGPDDLTGGEQQPGAHSTGAVWQPVRVLRAPGLSVACEDTDPFRHCYPWPVAPRLGDAELAGWQDLFRDAWQEIGRGHAAYAPGLAAGLTTLVPLSGAPDDRQAGTAARQAPGAVAIARPTDPVTLALLLICGFQQVKLDAITDLYDLYDRADDRLFPAPWGEGKQHLDGLFRDTYAHLAGTRFWHARQHAAPGQAPAEPHARWRADTLEAIQTLAGSGSLTPLGTSFVEGMRDSARSLGMIGPSPRSSTSNTAAHPPKASDQPMTG
jgi:uncharacterized protein